MYKIIYGIPAMRGTVPSQYLNSKGHIENYMCGDYESIWCDFELDYYPEGNYYKFSFETMLAWDEKDGCRNWIIHCLSCLTEYMDKNGIAIDRELNMNTVFTNGVDVNTRFESIQDAYAWLKMIVFGFHGEGL